MWFIEPRLRLPDESPKVLQLCCCRGNGLSCPYPFLGPVRSIPECVSCKFHIITTLPHWFLQLSSHWLPPMRSGCSTGICSLSRFISCYQSNSHKYMYPQNRPEWSFLSHLRWTSSPKNRVILYIPEHFSREVDCQWFILHIPIQKMPHGAPFVEPGWRAASCMNVR